MEKAGAFVERLDPPVTREEIWDGWTTLRSLSIAAGNEADYASPNARAQMKEALIWEIERGLAMSGNDIRRASAARARLFTALAGLFAEYDALAIPTTQVWPFPVETVHPTEIAGVQMDTYHRWMECMVPASLTGLPALSIPVGFGPEGLPAGMQLIGSKGSDDRLIALATAWHEASDWQKHTPPL
jgi:amidase